MASAHARARAPPNGSSPIHLLFSRTTTSRLGRIRCRCRARGTDRWQLIQPSEAVTARALIWSGEEGDEEYYLVRWRRDLQGRGGMACWGVAEQGACGLARRVKK
ncbi:unnamed protein product [Urochloa humidicola]